MAALPPVAELAPQQFEVPYAQLFTAPGNATLVVLVQGPWVLVGVTMLNSEDLGVVVVVNTSVAPLTGSTTALLTLFANRSSPATIRRGTAFRAAITVRCGVTVRTVDVPLTISASPVALDVQGAMLTTTTAVGVVSMVSLSPTSITGAMRGVALQRLVVCRSAVEDSGTAFIPLSIGGGQAPAAALRGAVVSNLAVAASYAVLTVALGLAFGACSSAPAPLLDAALRGLRVVHFPGNAAVPIGAVLQPTMLAAVALAFVDGGDPVTWAVLAVVCALSLGLFAWLWRCLLMDFPCVLTPPGAEGAHQKSAPRRLWDRLFEPREEWLASSGDACDWKQHHLPLFRDYRRPWHVVLELGLSALLGVVLAIPPSRVACNVQIAVVALSYAALLVLCTACRQMLTLFLAVQQAVVNALGVVACALLFVLANEDSPPLAMQSAVLLIAMLISALSLLKGAVDVLSVLVDAGGLWAKLCPAHRPRAVDGEAEAMLLIDLERHPEPPLEAAGALLSMALLNPVDTFDDYSDNDDDNPQSRVADILHGDGPLSADLLEAAFANQTSSILRRGM